MSAKQKKEVDAVLHYEKHVRPEIAGAPWIFRITEHTGKSVPVFVIKERLHPDQRTDIEHLVAPRSVLIERGLIHGPSQLRCLPVIQAILMRVRNEVGVPLAIHRYVPAKRIDFRGNLPLDDEAGYKLALIFKLQERIRELDRVELIARRVDRFTREEASYWYSRVSRYSDPGNRWAAAGMKIMLSGFPKDKHIEKMLDELRQKY